MSARPKIVVLDGFTLNPGDLSWDALRALGECEVHERTSASQTVERAREAEVVLTNKVVLDGPTIGRLPRLRYVGVLATGYNVVDVEAARARGVAVTNVPAYSTRSVAQLTLALLLELTHQVGRHARSVQEGQWSRHHDFSYSLEPLVELEGRSLGLVGFGRIGSAVAEVAAALGMDILVHTRTQPRAASESVWFVDLETLFRQSDVVSLHCPLTPETRHLVNAERLAWMKPTAFLLNTSRGLLIDEFALAEALNAGRLAGAGLDVLSVEPPPLEHPLLRARNCVITPHFGWATSAARARLLREAVENVRAFLKGEPRNVV